MGPANIVISMLFTMARDATSSFLEPKWYYKSVEKVRTLCLLKRIDFVISVLIDYSKSKTK